MEMKNNLWDAIYSEELPCPFCGKEGKHTCGLMEQINDSKKEGKPITKKEWDGCVSEFKANMEELHKTVEEKETILLSGDYFTIKLRSTIKLCVIKEIGYYVSKCDEISELIGTGETIKEAIDSFSEEVLHTHTTLNGFNEEGLSGYNIKLKDKLNNIVDCINI